MEEVNIPEDLLKFYTEGENGATETIMVVAVNDEVAVVVDEGYQPMDKPQYTTSEMDATLANEGLKLVDVDECPEYEVNL